MTRHDPASPAMALVAARRRMGVLAEARNEATRLTRVHTDAAWDRARMTAQGLKMAEPTMTKQQAQAEINRLIAEDRSFAAKLRDQRDPEHAVAQVRWRELNNLAAGQSPALPAAELPPREAAAAKIRELSADPLFYAKLSDPGNPDHGAARAEWARLNERAAAAPALPAR
jgi:hypothetical protein